MTWLRRIGAARLVRAGKGAGLAAHRVAVQGYQRATLAGAKLARRIISVQKAARLRQHLAEQSAQSVAGQEMTRPGDRAWQAGYAAEAVRQGVLAEPGRASAASAARAGTEPLKGEREAAG